MRASSMIVVDYEGKCLTGSGLEWHLWKKGTAMQKQREERLTGKCRRAGERQL